MQLHRVHQRFIIERPRLIELLDSLSARIVLITAPAGYGKSTLARQWAATRDDVLWYEATAASRDVAALGIDLIRLSDLAEEPWRQFETRIEALARPDEHAHELALTLADLLGKRWGGLGPTIVVDEADVVHSAPGAARFLQTLVASTAIRFVIIGRQRPDWASTRKLVYQEIDEVDRETLAFTEAEAAQLLTGLPLASARSLWSRARGWPAVLRLAALTQSTSLPRDALGSSLHEYFAEELYEQASADLQWHLPLLGLLPALDASVLGTLVGTSWRALSDEALELGFLSASGFDQFEMHPLLRAFLITKFDPQVYRALCEEMFFRLLDQSQWDNAFAMISNAELNEYLPQLVARSLDPLLGAGRLKTLEDWVRFGRSRAVDSPDLFLLEAELARRAGVFSLAHSHALRAAEAYRLAAHPWASRAFSLAGICSHFSSYSREADEYFAKGRTAAQSRHDSRQAIWGQFLRSHMHHDSDAAGILEEFAGYVDADPAAQVRLATGKFMLALIHGPLEATIRTEVEPYITLCQTVRDPLAKSAFYYQLGFGYVLIGRYTEALEVITLGEEEIRAQRLSFAQTHLAAARVAATIGLRRFKRAASLLDELVDLADRLGDSYEAPNAQGLRARLLLSMGDCELAAHELRDWAKAPTKALRSELAAVRALALAHAPSPRECEELAEFALTTSTDLQAHTAARAALAIVDLRAEREPETSRIGAFEDVIIARENYDGFVHAYRSYPNLLAVLDSRERVSRRRISTLLVAALDTRLASSIGLTQNSSPSAPLLTRREEEVFDLVRQGRTNKEIAQILFISESTAKVHVRHILDKLGARSRTEAVARYHEA